MIYHLPVKMKRIPFTSCIISEAGIYVGFFNGFCRIHVLALDAAIFFCTEAGLCGFAAMATNFVTVIS